MSYRRRRGTSRAVATSFSGRLLGCPSALSWPKRCVKRSQRSTRPLLHGGCVAEIRFPAPAQRHRCSVSRIITDQRVTGTIYSISIQHIGISVDTSIQEQSTAYRISVDCYDIFSVIYC